MGLKCALVNKTTMTVDNVIMADPSIDQNPDAGTYLFLPADEFVVIGTKYDGAKFVKPPAPVVVPTSKPPAVAGLETL